MPRRPSLPGPVEPSMTVPILGGAMLSWALLGVVLFADLPPALGFLTPVLGGATTALVCTVDARDALFVGGFTASIAILPLFPLLVVVAAVGALEGVVTPPTGFVGYLVRVFGASVVVVAAAALGGSLATFISRGVDIGN